MKQFISFVRKEFYHIFRDLRTMLILLGMPVVQIILFGFAITTEVKNVKVAVLDFSKDVSTRQIIDKLDASDYFNVNKILYDNNEIEETLRKSSSDLIIVFEAGFDNNLRHTGKARVQLIADATDPNNATILTSYAYDGSIAGISRTSAMDDYSQNGTLLCAVMRQSGYNSVAVCLCITCSGSRQSFFVGFALMDLHRSISAVGIIGFHYRPYPSGSHAVFGNGTDDAYRSTFRHDIPHREYASSFTADFKCHPCQMVYCRNQENHD